VTIEAGPTWQDDTAEDGRIEPRRCAACCEMAYVDKATELCRQCWRCWRFSQPLIIMQQDGGS